MKKLITLIAALGIVSFGISFGACKKDDAAKEGDDKAKEGDAAKPEGDAAKPAETKPAGTGN